MPDTALGQTRAAEQLSGELGWGFLCRRDGHLRPARGAPPSRGTRIYVAGAFIAIGPRSSLAQTRARDSAGRGGDLGAGGVGFGACFHAKAQGPSWTPLRRKHKRARPACGEQQVDHRPVFAAFLSWRHRHRSGLLSLPHCAESGGLSESAAWAARQQCRSRGSGFSTE
jgi:hypothetical protein